MKKQDNIWPQRKVFVATESKGKENWRMPDEDFKG
jgi:hypothetical protein